MALAGIATLLAVLREAGFVAGPTEVLRLREVFGREPDLPSRERLCSVLYAVLVKSTEDRALFDRIFDAWFEREEEEWRLAGPAEYEIEPEPSFRSRPRRSPWRAPWLLAAGWALLLATGLLLQERPPLPPKVEVAAETGPSPPPPPLNGPAGSSVTADQVRQRTFEAWIPTFEVIPAPWSGWRPLGLALAALGGTAGLWLWQRRRPPNYWVMAAAPPPPGKGPPRRFLPPPASKGPQLLAPPEQEAMVWGIDHFTAGEPIRRLDLTATVRATVRAGGVPHLVFWQARHAREVWLWVDETADDPTLGRAADEIEEALRAYGLPVERAAFRGVPQQLVTAQGAVFAPSELDERRDVARVAVLTDGRQLARQAASDRRRVGNDALLRQLSNWPRLAFVDFSRGEGHLALLLAPHGLARIAPEELAGFLGGSTERVRRCPAGPETEAWAAACALSPAPVAEETALALRRRLFPRVSPWALGELRVAAPGPPGRLWWSPEDRVRLLNRLSAAELQDGETVAAGSRLDQALAFWEDRYSGVLLDVREAELPPASAERRWLAERLLLQLWRDPGRAVRRLYVLFQGGLQDVIREAMISLTATDSRDGERIRLPWNWAGRPATERVLLAKMGFGGGRLPPPGLRQPGRAGLALGLGLGLAAGGLGAAGWSTSRAVTEGEPIVVKDISWPADAVSDVAPVTIFDWPSRRTVSMDFGHAWGVVIATTRIHAFRTVAHQDRIYARWNLARQPCAEAGPQGIEIWRCGRESPPFSVPLKRHRAIVLNLDSPRSQVEALALALLDSGSAHKVIIAPGAKGVVSALQQDPERFGPQAQILALTSHPDPWQDALSFFLPQRFALLQLTAPTSHLLAGLQFDGSRKLSEVWPALPVLRGDPEQIELRGLGTEEMEPCRMGETLVENGFTFVRICGGTFIMGTEENEPLADYTEKPAHQVTLSEFWLAQTETTEAQYRRDRSGRATLPATNIGLDEARAFCHRFGYRLPTEAEWEYAARAGTRTSWSFDGDEKELKKYAWFGQGIDGQPHPVGQKLPNPWGLSDMHGNVWEWVADWWHPYANAPQVDPMGLIVTDERLLRGGSFANVPTRLRSAYRGRFQTGIVFREFGFRCARDRRRVIPTSSLSEGGRLGMGE